MLIEFSVGNYLSFKDKVTFSMVATDLGAKTELDENNTFQVDKELTLLKSAAVYGANASGKSNIIKAIRFMRWFVLNSSSSTQITDLINISEFRLSEETINKPSFFEIVFILNNKIYRYGFQLTKKEIIAEWLYYTPNSQEYKYFSRKKQNFKVLKKFSEGHLLQSKTRANALFLSVVAQFNGKISEQLLIWFQKLSVLSIISNFNHAFTLGIIEDDNYKNKILSLIKKLDLAIHDIKIKQTVVPLEKIPQDLLELLVEREERQVNGLGEWFSIDIKTIHNKYDLQGNIYSTEEFDLDENESEGTKKLFAIAGYILNALQEGRVLLIDELDARLHPLITQSIIKLFNSKETNPNNAQLIFMTHDTNLLSKKLFRSDQIWFVEKNRCEATDLYSLAEYKISKDASFEDDYVKGKYGAIPYIGNLRDLNV